MIQTVAQPNYPFSVVDVVVVVADRRVAVRVGMAVGNHSLTKVEGVGGYRLHQQLVVTSICILHRHRLPYHGCRHAGG